MVVNVEPAAEVICVVMEVMVSVVEHSPEGVGGANERIDVRFRLPDKMMVAGAEGKKTSVRS